MLKSYYYHKQSLFSPLPKYPYQRGDEKTIINADALSKNNLGRESGDNKRTAVEPKNQVTTFTAGPKLFAVTIG